MAKERILQDALTDELRRAGLRERIDCCRNEIIDDEERQILLDRIRRPRKTLDVLAR